MRTNRTSRRFCSYLAKGLSLALAGVAFQSAHAVNGTWINPVTGGLWSAGANWDGGNIADGIDAIADFSTLELTANNTVNLDSARTVGFLIFGDLTPSHNWIIGTGNTLTLQTSAGTPTITVNNQTATIQAVLAGTQGLIKNGAGNLFLSGGNSGFTGGIALNAGTLTVGGLGTGAGTSANTITAASGTTIAAASGSSNVQAGIVLSGANANVTVTNNNASGGFGSLVTGSADQTLTISSAGGQPVNFNAANPVNQFANFLGTVNVPLGSTLSFRATSLNNGGTNTFFQVDGNVTTRNNGTLNLGSLAGTGTLGSGGSGTAGTTLGYVIGARGDSTTFSGLIRDGDATHFVSVTKTGAGTLTLSGPNTYTGNTTINNGKLSISASNNLGATTNQIGLTLGGTLQATGNVTTDRKINLGSRGGTSYTDMGQVSGTLEATSGNTLELTGQILGNVAGDPGTTASRLRIAGAGVVFLNNTTGTANAFSGGVYINGGTLKTGPGPQFGDSLLFQDAGGTIISNQDGVFGANSFIGTGGAVRETAETYTVFRTGTIANINEGTGNRGGLTIKGDQTTVNNSAGTVGLGGVNTFGGTGESVSVIGTVTQPMTLSISQDANMGNSANALNLTNAKLAIEHGQTGLAPTAVAVAANVVTARTITLAGANEIFVSDKINQDPGVAAGLAPAAINNGVLGQMTVQGAGKITGTGSLNKTGVGTLTLAAGTINDYSGATTVTAGTMIVNGSITNSAVTVNGGLLGGSGSITNSVTVNSGGSISPGNSPGTLTTGALSLNSGGNFLFELNSSTLAADQVIANGAVSISTDALFNFTDLGAGVIAANTSFVVIANDGVDAISGNFNGLAQGTQFTSGANTYEVSYTGGTGNDFTLTVVPEPATVALMGIGFATVFWRRRNRLAA